MTSSWAAVPLLLVAGLAGGGPRTPAPPAAPPGTNEDRPGVVTPLALILERAGRYVLEYEQTFRDLVAEETYRQWGADPRGFGTVARSLRSDLVFVKLPGPLPWGTFRDVYEVDGQKVRDRERRLQKLFFAPRESDYAQAQAILNESSRYNLGQAYRNVNVPTLGLLFLRPENQPRLAFRRKGMRSIAGFPAVEVAFEERASPTLAHDRWGDDVPASGRFWVDETRGAVLRTEVDYDLEKEKTTSASDSWERGLVATEYRREPSLGCLVPDVMTELYQFRGIGRIDSVARYSNYRRFDVFVGTAAVMPLTYGAAPAPGSAHEAALEASPAAPPAPPASDVTPAPSAAPKEVEDLRMLPAPESPGAVGSLLQRAGEYVLRYEQRFRRVAAREAYEQRTTDSRATLPARVESEVVFTMTPGPVPWTLFRDALVVDGRTIRDRGRLEPLFRSSPGGGAQEAAGIARQSRERILGSTRRHLSVPTAALACLHPDNRDRFRFGRRWPAEVDGQEVVAVDFEEIARPTLDQDALGGDVALRGTFWIREADGAVLRSRTERLFDVGGSPGASLTVTTEYRLVPAAGLLAPIEMQEALEWRATRGGRLTGSGSASREAEPGAPAGSAAAVPVSGSVEAVARYSGFHSLATEGAGAERGSR